MYSIGIQLTVVTVIFRVMLKMIWMKRRCWPVMMRMRKMRRVGLGGGDSEEEKEELPKSSNILHYITIFIVFPLYNNGKNFVVQHTDI